MTTETVGLAAVRLAGFCHRRRQSDATDGANPFDWRVSATQPFCPDSCTPFGAPAPSCPIRAHGRCAEFVLSGLVHTCRRVPPFCADSGARVGRSGVRCCAGVGSRDNMTCRGHSSDRPAGDGVRRPAFRVPHPRRCTPAAGPIRRPARGRCRSTRRRRSCSVTPPRRPICSRCRRSARSTAGSRTRRSPRSRSAWRRSRVGSAPSAPPAARPPSSSRWRRSPAPATISSPAPSSTAARGRCST